MMNKLKNERFSTEYVVPKVIIKTFLGWCKLKDWEHLSINNEGVYIDGKLFAKGKLELVS